MSPRIDYRHSLNRRGLLQRSTSAVGAAALAGLMARDSVAQSSAAAQLTHFAPKAKRIVYLFQSGGPSQMDLFDY